MLLVFAQVDHHSAGVLCVFGLLLLLLLARILELYGSAAEGNTGNLLSFILGYFFFAVLAHLVVSLPALASVVVVAIVRSVAHFLLALSLPLLPPVLFFLRALVFVLLSLSQGLFVLLFRLLLLFFALFFALPSLFFVFPPFLIALLSLLISLFILAVFFVGLLSFIVVALVFPVFVLAVVLSVALFLSVAVLVSLVPVLVVVVFSAVVLAPAIVVVSLPLVHLTLALVVLSGLDVGKLLEDRLLLDVVDLEVVAEVKAEDFVLLSLVEV